MTTITTALPVRRASRVPVRAARPAPTRAGADLIVWATETDGIWQGTIGLIDAGTIRRSATGYVVTGWDGHHHGVYPSLSYAQQSLEPSFLALQRDEQETRRDAVGRTIAASAAVFAPTAAAAAGVLFALPL